MTREVFLRAPAKLNLVLRVGARRADGYHEVNTLFAAIALADDLHVRRVRSGITLEVMGADLGDPRDNLVYRAAEAYLCARGGQAGVAIRLKKRIPVGGGLGGGSSDAAATFRCLDALFPRGISATARARLARSLGADVSFFLSPTPFALGTGRGDRLTPLPSLPSLPVLLLVPPEGVGTAWAYARLARDRKEKGGEEEYAASGRRLTPAACADWERLSEMAHNDFEASVVPARPALGRALKALRATAPLLALMSGSGSTLFAVYRTQAARARARRQLGRVLTGFSLVSSHTLARFAKVRPQG